MFLCAEHVRWWKMNLKYTVNPALYHILLLQIVEMHLFKFYTFLCSIIHMHVPQQPAAVRFIKYDYHNTIKWLFIFGKLNICLFLLLDTIGNGIEDIHVQILVTIS